MGERTDPLRFDSLEAPGGLRIVRQPAPVGAATFSATFVAPAGWGYDPSGREGTSRLASLLVTAGAGSRGRLDLARLLDRLGATLSASSDPESAEVTVWGPSEVWETLLGVLADAVVRPRFEVTDLARVRRQIAERQMRELAQPGMRADRDLLRALYPVGHPYRESGMGTPRTVARIGGRAIVQFRARHFTRRGSILVTTGRPSTLAVVRAAGRLFEDLADGPPPGLRTPPPRTRSPRELRVDMPGRSQVEVRLGGGSIGRSDPRFAGAYLANEVLGGGTLLSRLFRRVRARGGLAYHASSQLEAMRGGGYWTAQAGTGRDRWTKVVPMLQEEVERITGANIPRPELETMCESRIGEMALSLESTADAHELAVDAAYHGLPGDHWVRWPSVLRALTPRDVRAAAEAALDPRASVTVVTGPIGPK
jgi:zinc protease